MLQAPVQSFWSNAKFLCPVRQWHTLALKSYWCDVPRVFGLLRPRCPSRVLRRIWPIVINPVQTIQRTGSRANIGEKRFEILPSFADKDTASAIVFILGSLRIRTALPHAHEHLIFTPMFLCARPMNHDVTSTTGYALQYRTTHNSFIATNATAQPMCTTGILQPCTSKVNHFQEAKGLTTQVFDTKRGQSCDRLVTSHDACTSNACNVVRAPKCASTPSGLVISSESIALYDIECLRIFAMAPKAGS